MKTIIYDGHNWLRRRFEVGASMRSCIDEYKQQPGLFIMDGKGSRARRTALYPDYKKGRKPPVTAFYTQLDIFQAAMSFLPGVFMRVPGWEADDVIATIVRASPNADFFIFTNDLDLSQLPGVVTENQKTPPAPPEELHLYKTLVGDPSDHIPGLSLFGPKAYGKLSPLAKQLLMEGFERKISIHDDNGVLQGELGDKLFGRMSAAEPQLRVFWEITALMTVPDAEIKAAMKIGTPDETKLEVFLSTLGLEKP